MKNIIDFIKEQREKMSEEQEREVLNFVESLLQNYDSDSVLKIYSEKETPSKVGRFYSRF